MKNFSIEKIFSDQYPCNKYPYVIVYYFTTKKVDFPVSFKVYNLNTIAKKMDVNFMDIAKQYEAFYIVMDESNLYFKTQEQAQKMIDEFIIPHELAMQLIGGKSYE